MNLDRIIFGWGCSSYHGWGVVGLNLMLYWPGEAICAVPDIAVELPLGDNRYGLLVERIGQSVGLQRELTERQQPAPIGPARTPVFVALGNDFMSPLGERALKWCPPHENIVAFPVFEDLLIAELSIERLKPYPRVIAASRWNRDFLTSQGIAAELCHQGYDPVLFHPGVRRRRDDGRFRVFSGGKAEWRKGQDIVLRAFARFAEHHDDAVLVAAWGSPWPGLAQSFAEHGIDPPPGAEHGMPNFRAWAQSFGIKPHQIEIVPPRPNWRMAEIYAGVDVALFPNRAEGGTNLVAMECIACGVPTIIEATTGQADLAMYAAAAFETGGDPVAFEEQLETAYHSTPFVVKLDAWAWPERIAHLRRTLNEG